jgi:RHS repeat-associated protein
MRRHYSLAAIVLCLAARSAAQPAPVGPEILVNITTAGQQAAPAAAAGPSGLHAAAWQAPGDSTDVWLQVWEGDGSILLPELRVNSHLTGCQEAPAVAFASDGSFVVLWQSEEQDGSGWGIFGQRFAADGSLVGGEFQVNLTTSGDQQAPAVAYGPSGSFTVVWESFGQDGDGWGVYARRFNASGPLSGEVQVAPSGTGHQRRPAVAIQPPGNVLVAWEGPDGSGPGVAADARLRPRPAVTTHEYDLFGDLLRATRPRGNVLEYGHDSAGRLTSLESKPDAATPGERTLYTLDKAGHRIQEDLQSWNGSAWVTQAWTQYRLIKITQPDVQAGDVTSYAYDVQDHLQQVTDAEKNVTTYTYGDRDLLTQESSPVSGIQSYVYNDHGELVQETDARGVIVARTYDALDRVTAVTYPDPSLDVTYTYDAPGAFSMGRLTGITRHGQTIVYDHDRFGRLTRDGDLLYGYDLNGNRATIGYPEELVASYTYDYSDRQNTLSVTVDGGPPLALASNATYKPFGPLTSLSLGNGLTETRTYDQRYQPATIQVAGGSTLLNWSYTLDAVGNITAITDLLNPANNRTFAYQDLYYFLTQGNGPWGPRAWTYDKIGNRLTEALGAVTDTYSYPVNAGGGKNPKLQLVTEGDGGLRQYSYDGAGNTQQMLDYDLDQRLDLIHDGAGRLAFMRSRAPESKLVAMTYDGRGFLSKAEDAGGGCFAQQTLATYSSEGMLHRREHRLLDGTGSIPVQSDALLYFSARPLAMLKQNGGSLLTFLSTDHLGSPVLATRETGSTTWQGGFEPFGDDYSGAVAAEVFLRLPGQWADGAWSREAPARGLYYHVHRWYGVEIGRYLQPDAIGVPTTVNLFGYADFNPIRNLDPMGLYTTAGFSPRQEVDIALAVDWIRQILTDDPCCTGSHDLSRELLERLDHPGLVFEYGGNHPTRCGFSPPRTVLGIQRKHILYDGAWDCCFNGSPKGPISLGSTILHELTHFRFGGESRGYGLEETCFGCFQGLP